VIELLARSKKQNYSIALFAEMLVIYRTLVFKIKFQFRPDALTHLVLGRSNTWMT